MSPSSFRSQPKAAHRKNKHRDTPYLPVTFSLSQHQVNELRNTVWSFLLSTGKVTENQPINLKSNKMRFFAEDFLRSNLTKEFWPDRGFEQMDDEELKVCDFIISLIRERAKAQAEEFTQMDSLQKVGREYPDGTSHMPKTDAGPASKKAMGVRARKLKKRPSLELEPTRSIDPGTTRIRRVSFLSPPDGCPTRPPTGDDRESTVVSDIPYLAPSTNTELQTPIRSVGIDLTHHDVDVDDLPEILELISPSSRTEHKTTPEGHGKKRFAHEVDSDGGESSREAALREARAGKRRAHEHTLTPTPPDQGQPNHSWLPRDIQLFFDQHDALKEPYMADKHNDHITLEPQPQPRPILQDERAQTDNAPVQERSTSHQSSLHSTLMSPPLSPNAVRVASKDTPGPVTNKSDVHINPVPNAAGNISVSVPTTCYTSMASAPIPAQQQSGTLIRSHNSLLFTQETLANLPGVFFGYLHRAQDHYEHLMKQGFAVSSSSSNNITNADTTMNSNVNLVKARLVKVLLADLESRFRSMAQANADGSLRMGEERIPSDLYLWSGVGGADGDHVSMPAL